MEGSQSNHLWAIRVFQTTVYQRLQGECDRWMKRDVWVDKALQEARNDVIELLDEDPDIVARVLIYLYNPVFYANVADWINADCSEVGIFNEARRRQALLIPDDRSCRGKRFYDSLPVHAKVHGLSQKYDIPDLTRVSCERFVEWVAHLIEIDSTLTACPEDGRYLVDVIKIVYGSQQASDLILREAAVYLARKYARSIQDNAEEKDVQRNILAFKEVCSSVDNFAWDMMTLNFENARFACAYCEHEFVIPKNQWKAAKCRCGRRGICGKCAPISQIECPSCLQRGACGLIEWKTKDSKIKSWRQQGKKSRLSTGLEGGDRFMSAVGKLDNDRRDDLLIRPLMVWQGDSSCATTLMSCRCGLHDSVHPPDNIWGWKSSRTQSVTKRN